MTSPHVSVILATYNGSRFLREAIESVLSQEYSNFELIIVDDASTDLEVGEILESYKKQDNRIISLRNQRNMERSWSKNIWVQHARGEYIAFIDDDDIWNKDKLSRQLQVLESHPDIGIVGTFARFIDESGKLLWETYHLKITPEDIRWNILITNQFIHSSVLIRKSVFERSWGFPEGMNLCEDYDLWFRILEVSQGINIPESLVYYRVRTSSTTAKNIYRMKYYSLMLMWKYRKHFPRFFQASITRLFLFPFNTVLLLKIWKKLNRIN